MFLFAFIGWPCFELMTLVELIWLYWDVQEMPPHCSQSHDIQRQNEDAVGN